MYSNYCKGNNWHAKFSTATHLIAPTWLKWFNIFRNLFLSESIFFFKGTSGLLSTWRLLFTFLWKKGFCAKKMSVKWNFEFLCIVFFSGFNECDHFHVLMSANHVEAREINFHYLSLATENHIITFGDHSFSALEKCIKLWKKICTRKWRKIILYNK